MFTPEVSAALGELKDAYGAAAVTAQADPQGGAYVTVDPVEFGDHFTPATGWIRFHITFQYPAADIYPHFIPRTVRRADGKAVTPGTPLGVGTSEGSYTHGTEQFDAIQLSRRSNRWNPATDSAVLKLVKVLAWLREM